MCNAKESHSEAPIQEINGVSLFTKAGRPKSRYSDEERLRILGATSEDLEVMMELFCPGRPVYAMTRAGSSDPRSWTTPKGRITEREVLLHLLGNLIPERPPRWVAPRSWEVTKWVGIDIDYRGDREDFHRRCRRVFKALNVLGVTEKRRLVSTTPSGGIHVRFFLSGVIKVEWIPQVLGHVGLHESPGQIELFPSMKKGMRLPFGYLPGRKHNAEAWLNFIRAYRGGEFPLVDWLKCMKRGERFAEAQLDKQPQPDQPISEENCPAPSSQSRKRNKHHRFHLGVPKRSREHVSVDVSSRRQRYLDLLSTPCRNPDQAGEIWNLGIQAKGTRTAVTKILAWHMIRVRRLPVSVVKSELTSWVYETGKTTSNDVMQDLECETRKVEQQTWSIVDWCANLGHEATGFIKSRSTFSEEEVNEIIRRLKASSIEMISFALHFLGFAKLNGRETDRGWETQIAVNPVIRKWPECSGDKYKLKMDRLAHSGLIEMTREKRQSSNKTGRPRTYEFKISPRLCAGATMCLASAIDFAAATVTSQQLVQSKGTSHFAPSDTYKRFKPLTTLKTRQEEKKVAAQVNNESGNAGQDSRQALGDPSLAVCSSAHEVKPGTSGTVAAPDKVPLRKNVPLARPVAEPVFCRGGRTRKQLFRRLRSRRLRRSDLGLTEFAKSERQRFNEGRPAIPLPVPITRRPPEFRLGNHLPTRQAFPADFVIALDNHGVDGIVGSGRETSMSKPERASVDDTS